MNNVQIFDLRPINGRKSFYGKALVIIDGDTVYLRSYETIVCAIRNGVFHRLWYGHSVTTMIHVNAFRVTYGLPKMTNRQWFDMDCGMEV